MLETFVKAATLSSVGLAANVGTYLALSQVAKKVAPGVMTDQMFEGAIETDADGNITVNVSEINPQDIMAQRIKRGAIILGIGLIAGAVAYLATDAVENAFFSEEETPLVLEENVE